MAKEKQYIVMQVTLKEKFIGTASKNLDELEDVINNQCAKAIACTQFPQHPQRVLALAAATVYRQRLCLNACK